MHHVVPGPHSTPVVTAAGIVLAAGGASRMGSPKQLLPVGGRPLLQVVLDAACASRLDRVVVVLGANAKAVSSGVIPGRAQVIVNQRHAEGMSTSLHAGVGALDSEVDVAVVILGDQPDVSAAMIDSLLDAQLSSGLPAAALSVDGLFHPPVVLARELWPAVLALRGDVGLRAVLRAHPELVAALPAASRGDRPVDIDTPDDLARLRRDR
jgi:molybdenum cofactor cytidylyltransferase